MEMDENDEDKLYPGAVIKFDSEYNVDLHVADNVGNTKKIKQTFKLDDFDGEGDTKKKKYHDGGTEYHLTAELLVKA